MNSSARSVACLLALVACVPIAGPRPITPERSVAALSIVRGRFVEAGEGFALLPATAADDSTLRQISALEQSVVPTLIEGLADTSPARVQYAAAPTSLGAVCFYALINTHFVQERLGRGGDQNPASRGWVRYRAIEPEQRQRARSEWRAWFKRQTR